MAKGAVMVQIRTTKESKQTLGTAFVFSDAFKELFRCKTLELPWKNNQRRVSCIPVGDYIVKKRYTEARGWHFHVQDVEGRTWILWHSGNFHHEILGCTLPGNGLRDMDRDGFRDVLNSRDTLDKLIELMPDEFPLIIADEWTN